MGLLRTAVYETSIRIGSCTISFQRTLRVPDRGDGPYPLPPTFGPFPVVVLARTPLMVGIPVYRREAMWIAFECNRRPNAVLVGAGSVNAISGQPWQPELRRNPQNYIVCPDQPWLDGFKTGPGVVRQFVAVETGHGETASEQLAAGAPAEDLRLVVFEGVVDLKPIPRPPKGVVYSQPMGLAAGGEIVQNLYRDPYGKKMWDPDRKGGLTVKLMPVGEYRERTGREAPETPVDTAAYVRAGLPWFELYEENATDVEVSGELARLARTGQDEPITVPGKNVRKIRRLPPEGPDSLQ